MRDFARAVFGFPAMIGQGFIGEDDAMPEIAFQVQEENTGKSNISISAEREPVDDHGPHLMVSDLQLEVGRLSENLDGIGFEQVERVNR